MEFLTQTSLFVLDFSCNKAFAADQKTFKVVIDCADKDGTNPYAALLLI